VESLKAALQSAPAVVVKARLTRRVEFLALARYDPPNWLFTSGKPKRYNPAGVHCVYFGRDVTATRAEYEQMWKGLKGADQPATEFIAEVDLQSHFACHPEGSPNRCKRAFQKLAQGQTSDSDSIARTGRKRG
jgi:hypothetical protein